MHGDLSRVLFDPAKLYTTIRLQQGRVVLDADVNEGADLFTHDVRRARVDIIGPSGTPDDEPGFGVTGAGAAVNVAPGRYYVNGIRVENLATGPIALTAQPFAPGSALPAVDGAYAAWLETWEHPVTALQDPELREAGLGGPDTTLRHQAAWAIRLKRVGDTANVAQAQAVVDGVDAARNGGLRVREVPPAVTTDPCIVAPSAGYRGLENRLYRVQIARGSVDLLGNSTGQTPQYVWSRDNGSVVAAISSPIDRGGGVTEINVDRLGPGGTSDLEAGQWVELTNDARTLNLTPMVLALITEVLEGSIRVQLPLVDVTAITSGAHPILRRWDSVGLLATHAGFAALEHGVEVRFDAGGYRCGDFWLIPARTAVLPGTTNTRIDWPADEATVVPPFGYRRYRALVAVVQRAGTWSTGFDARRRFTSLTELTLLTTFAATSGDGQHGRGGVWLPAPASVLVFRGDHAETGVRVRFDVAEGGGALSAVAPAALPPGAASVIVTTAADGVARVWWRLGTGPVTSTTPTAWPGDLVQTITAVRLGPDDTPIGPAQRFHAIRTEGTKIELIAGDAQIGRPGALLDLSLRVRATWLGRPLQNSNVTFELSRAFNGNTMTEAQAGGMNAPVAGSVVSGNLWPSSGMYWRVTVRTDDDGVAQVQLKLGNELGLPTRIVRAWLADVAPPELTEVMFSAHLAVAQEIEYQPTGAPLSGLLSSFQDKTVQRAIDELARIVDGLMQQDTATYQPFVGLAWEDVGGVRRALGSNDQISLTQLRAFVFDAAMLLRPGTGGVNASTMSGLRVEVDLPVLVPIAGNIPLTRAMDVSRLSGSITPVGDTHVRWQIGSESVSWLNEQVFNNRPWAVSPVIPGRLVVVPRHLARAEPQDATLRYEWNFRLVR